MYSNACLLLYLKAGELDLPCGGIERREQHVLSHHTGARQRVQERRLPGVGVPDQGDHRQPELPATASLKVAVLTHPAKFLLQSDDLVLQQTPERCDRGLTRSGVCRVGERGGGRERLPSREGTYTG